MAKAIPAGGLPLAREGEERAAFMFGRRERPQFHSQSTPGFCPQSIHSRRTKTSSARAAYGRWPRLAGLAMTINRLTPSLCLAPTRPHTTGSVQSKPSGEARRTWEQTDRHSQSIPSHTDTYVLVLGSHWTPPCQHHTAAAGGRRQKQQQQQHGQHGGARGPACPTSHPPSSSPCSDPCWPSSSSSSPVAAAGSRTPKRSRRPSACASGPTRATRWSEPRQSTPRATLMSSGAFCCVWGGGSGGGGGRDTVSARTCVGGWRRGAVAVIYIYIHTTYTHTHTYIHQGLPLHRVHPEFDCAAGERGGAQRDVRCLRGACLYLSLCLMIHI
jgi:hypothetical protein